MFIPFLAACMSVPRLAPSPARSENACGASKLAFFSGFRMMLPQPMCVERWGGPDYWIYSFRTGDASTEPFLSAYVGHAADAPYTAPPEGRAISEYSTEPKTSCGEIIVRERRVGDVVQVGGTRETEGLLCGEFLVRAATDDCSISSAGVHFWFDRLRPEQASLAMAVINATKRGPTLRNEPPLPK